MKIHFPNSAFLGNIDQFLASMDMEDKARLSITFNKKWVWSHPMALSMAVALGLEVRSRNGAIDIEPMEAKSRHYFERMKMFESLGVSSGMQITDHEPSGRFIPLTIITNSVELNRFITEMVPLLHSNPVHVEPIRYVISELVRNVFEHSRSKHGAIVSAQYYKKSNSIKIGVADSGVGVRDTISVSHRTESDKDAIRLALMPGITGGTASRLKGTESNAGAGLFFTKSIAKVNRDFFVIYSGNCMFKLLKTPQNKRIELKADPFDDRHSLRDDLPYWQGTVVGIDINLNRHEGFDSLLDMIRAVYKKEIKERNRERLKRARFL